MDIFYSLHDLDKKMLQYINFENGIFIECGANDGITQSNTFYFEKNLGWKGLLVEPNYFLSEECKKNRPNSIVENYALVSKNYDKNTVRGDFNCYPGLMSKVVDTGDYYDQHIVNERISINKHEIINVNAITLTQLLIKHNIEKIDFFSLDVEGYEIDVLNGLDFDVFRPKFILIETANREEYQNSVRKYMIEKKYDFIERLSVNDDLFIDKNSIN